MVKIKILTNNDWVYDLMNAQNHDCDFLDDTAVAVVKEATQMMLIHGWRLASDPLAGCNSRQNPYHTIFLQLTPDADAKFDMLRFEKLICRWQKCPAVPYALTSIYADFKQLDLSIAKHTSEQLFKYGVYE